MSNLAKGPTVANTKKSTDRALRVFCEWRRQRNASQPEKCPSDLLESPSAQPLNYWLSRCSVEARRADGDRYPSSTIYQLLAGLLRYATVVVTFNSFKNNHYVRCNLSHYVLHYNSLLLQYSNLPHYLALVQQPTSAVQLGLSSTVQSHAASRYAT